MRSVVDRLKQSGSAQTARLVALDIVVVAAATLASYALRFEGAVPAEWADSVWIAWLAAAVTFVVLFAMFGLYGLVWRYVGVDVVIRLASATVLGTVLLAGGDVALSAGSPSRAVPVSIPFIIGILVFVGSTSIRSYERLQVYLGSRKPVSGSRIIIAGAGDAGSLILRDIENQPDLGYHVIGFVDDDESKQGRLIRGVKVLGGVDRLEDLVRTEGVAEVFVAMPSASVEQRRRVLDACNAAEVPIRIVPSIARDRGSVGLSDLRQVSIEDLLGRDPVEVDVEAISAALSDKVVAVTGAAGSIGAELCRQIMLMHPRRLHLLEIDETRLYEVYLELRESDPDVPQMHICDIRNEEKTRAILAGAGVDVVFHAAAYKHVPLMELAPDEAVKANVGGTRGILRACAEAGVDHFVLISTDKAVNPSSVMGATKALAERLTFHAARRGLKCTAVRFGNVLGSRGSVVPLFERQLRNGGPVLVTHPDVTRYFMTIPEAAKLVLQAQALSDGGELFVLEMGEPIRIVDLARKMIALSGSAAQVEFQGLRPGEKRHEVLAHEDHELVPTGSEKVLRLNALPIPGRDFEVRVDELIELARSSRSIDVLDRMGALLSDFDPSSAKLTCHVIDPGTLGMDAEMETLF